MLQFNNYYNKSVTITTNSGSRYAGKLHEYDIDIVVVSNLVIINFAGGYCKSGSNESRKFKKHCIKEIVEGY